MPHARAPLGVRPLLSLLLLSLILVLLCIPATGRADVLEEALRRLEGLKPAVEIDARSVEYLEREGQVAARGGVRIRIEDRVLAADEVMVDLEAETLTAEGNVVLMEGLNRLEGDRLEYDYRNNVGTMTRARGFLAPATSFAGMEVRKEGERHYRLVEGSFTTCGVCQVEPGPPDWEFRGKEVEIFQDELALGTGVSVWLRGLPVAYAPVFGVPLGPRRTGFLLPRIGYGTRNGFKFGLPFYWAISESQDATLTPTYRSRRGFEFEGEYRYILGEHARGEAMGRFLHDRESLGLKNRAEFRWRHDQEFDPTLAFRADMRYLNDRALPRDLVDLSVADRTTRVLPSVAFAEKATDRYGASVGVDVSRDLSQTTQAANTRLARLPELRFQLLPLPVAGLPVTVDAATAATYFERDRGSDLFRLDLHPSLALPVRLVPGITATTAAGFRETAYSGGERGEEAISRELFEVEERLEARLYRTFRLGEAPLREVTHLVEPSVRYAFIPVTSQRNLPQFDLADFISSQNRVTYALVNRFVLREQEEDGVLRSREVLTLGAAQSVNLATRPREFSDVFLTTLTPERIDQAVREVGPVGDGFSRAQERSLSNLVFSLGIHPLPVLSFRGALAFNLDKRTNEASNGAIRLTWPQVGFVEVGGTYVHGQGVRGTIARLGANLTRTLSLQYGLRYDFKTTTALENQVELRLATCCWDLAFAYVNRTRGIGLPVENNFNVRVELRTGAALGP